MQGPQKDVNLVGPESPKGPVLPRAMFDNAWMYRAKIARIQRNHAWRQARPGELNPDQAQFCYERLTWWKRFCLWFTGQ